MGEISTRGIGAGARVDIVRVVTGGMVTDWLIGKYAI